MGLHPFSPNSVLPWRYPPLQTLDGVPHPDLGWGYPQLDLGWGYLPVQIVMGVPLPRKCGQTENITFPHPSDAGGKNVNIPRS